MKHPNGNVKKTGRHTYLELKTKKRKKMLGMNMLIVHAYHRHINGNWSFTNIGKQGWISNGYFTHSTNNWIANNVNNFRAEV